MNNQVREQLRNIVLDNGVAVLDDFGRCEALFRHAFGQYRLETSALMSALHEGVPAELQHSRVSRRADASALAGRLENNCGLNNSVALWATEAWAYALDIPLQMHQAIAPIQPALTPRQPKGKPSSRHILKVVGGALVLTLGVLFWLYAPAPSSSVATIVPPPAAAISGNAGVERSELNDAQPVTPAPEPSPAPMPSETKALPIKPKPTPAMVQPATEVANNRQPAPPTPREPVRLTIPTGVTITVRISEEVDSETASVGDQVKAVVDSPVSVDEAVAVHKGTAAVLRVAAVQKARHFGRSEIKLQLVQMVLHNEAYALESMPCDVKASRGVIVKKGKGLTIPANEELEFSLAQPVTVTK